MKQILTKVQTPDHETKGNVKDKTHERKGNPLHLHLQTKMDLGENNKKLTTPSSLSPEKSPPAKYSQTTITKKDYPRFLNNNSHP